MTVHVSSCGSHLVALLRRSRLLLLYKFERVICREIELSNAIVDIQLGLPPTISHFKTIEWPSRQCGMSRCFSVFPISHTLDIDCIRHTWPREALLHRRTHIGTSVEHIASISKSSKPSVDPSGKGEPYLPSQLIRSLISAIRFYFWGSHDSGATETAKVAGYPPFVVF
jgi:hypothetical protein